MLDDLQFESCLRRLLAAEQAMPRREELSVEVACAEMAQARGWFMPDEDEIVRNAYFRYLVVRSSLLEVLQVARSSAGQSDVSWNAQLPCFALAFASAALLVRGSSYVIELAKKRPVIWKKLDEAEAHYGIPAKSFTNLHEAVTSPANLFHFRKAVQFYSRHQQEIHSLKRGSAFASLLEVLRNEATSVYVCEREIWLRRIFYRWYSLIRRNRSAYRKAMFHLFRISGSTIAELRQPGIKGPGAPKRISEAQRKALLEVALPGDVFITRHDDALSNLFLPGYWPHAALYVGEESVIKSNILQETEPAVFLEAKKDGVLLRAASETLHVDSCLMLRPPLNQHEMCVAMERATRHKGKRYDFLFDFRTADRLACTEVVYRAYHGIGDLHFSLVMKSGRACLPAENLIDQCLALGFTLVAVCNYRNHQISWGDDALADLAKSRCQNAVTEDSSIASDVGE